MTSESGSELSFARKVLTAVGIVVLTVLVLLLLYFTFDVLLLAFAAVLLAINAT